MHTKLTFEFAINPSLHIGDDIYFSSTNLDGITAAEPIYIGKVYSIFKNLNYIVINYDPTDDPVSQYVVGGATIGLAIADADNADYTEDREEKTTTLSIAMAF